MTNTKFRKRALLSSVAMLLVALLALGSATFAWFTQNLTAEAAGLKLNTSTSAGLVAKAASDERGFSHNTILNFDSTTYAGGTGAAQSSATPVPLQPASFCGTDINTTSATAGEKGKITFYNTSATAVDSYAGTNSFTSTSAIYDEIVYLRTTADASGDAIDATLSVASITVTIGQTEAITTVLKGCLRVAITDNNGKLVGVWTAPSAAKGSRDAYTHVNASHNGVVACAAASAGDGNYIMTTSGSPVVPANTISVTNDADDNYVHVIVYLDGEDENCKSNQVTNGADLTSGITISFTAAAAA